MSTYDEINKQLYALNFAKGSRMEIEGVRQIYQVLDLAEFPKVHVAGTNGKGSCVHKLSRALTQSGYRCGSFTSPHVASFRERVQVDGTMVSKSQAVQIITEIFDLALRLKVELTFFEITFLLAMKYFADQDVEVAIVEVGLGGRLDATNVISPILCIITSIGFDHMQILGNSLEKIAGEKAGIIKPNIPLIVGPKANQKSIRERAKSQNARLISVADQPFVSYDEENQAIAKEALSFLTTKFKLTQEAISAALTLKPPARFESHNFQGHDFIFDISHNVDGLKRFSEQVMRIYPKRKKLIFTSMAANHDYKSNLAQLSEITQKIYILDISHPRLQKADVLQSVMPGSKICTVDQVFEIVESFENQPLILVVGSIFIMDDMYGLINQKFEQDPEVIHDGVFNHAQP